MAAQILDGKATLAAIKDELKGRIATLAERGVVPGLGTVRVGEDPGSRWYVNAKHKDCAEVGIASIRYDLPAGAAQAEVEAVLDELNADPACTGYLVQQPTGLDESPSCPGWTPPRTSTACTPQPRLARLGKPRPCRARPWASSSCCVAMRSRSPAPRSSSSGVASPSVARSDSS